MKDMNPREERADALELAGGSLTEWKSRRALHLAYAEKLTCCVAEVLHAEAVRPAGLEILGSGRPQDDR